MSTLRPRSPQANAKKTYIFGYLGVTLLISFQGQLLVLDYLHHGPFKESGTWAETSMMIVGSVQCFAGPLFTLLQKRFHEQHCSLLRYLFHLAACCLLMCNIVFLVLVASSGQRSAMLDSDKERDDILPDGGANHGHEQTAGPEEEDEALQLHCAYFALFLLGLGQNFMRGCVLAKAATSTTPESSQHAFSRGVALSGLPGLVFMWLFPRPDGAMALGVFSGCAITVGGASWLGEQYLFDNADYEYARSPSDDVGDSTLCVNTSISACSGIQIHRRSSSPIDLPIIQLNLHSRHEVDQESPVGRGVWAVFWKTRRVVIGVFLLFTSLHLVWPALPLAIWPRPEDKDPDRIDFKILLSTFILADLLGRFVSGRQPQPAASKDHADEEQVDSHAVERSASATTRNNKALTFIETCSQDEHAVNVHQDIVVLSSTEEVDEPAVRAAHEDQLHKCTDVIEPKQKPPLTTTTKQHDPPTKEAELRDLYTDSTFLALVLLYGAATVPLGILLAVVELRPFALFFAIRVVTLFLSAFGWAHLSSTAYVLGPALVKTKREKDLAGPMVGHGIVLGIFVGTLLLRLGTLELVEAMQ